MPAEQGVRCPGTIWVLGTELGPSVSRALSPAPAVCVLVRKDTLPLSFQELGRETLQGEREHLPLSLLSLEASQHRLCVCCRHFQNNDLNTLLQNGRKSTQGALICTAYVKTALFLCCPQAGWMAI